MSLGLHTWFEEGQLFAGERLVRASKAKLRTDTPARWWEGELILTTDRLFFLAFVDNPLIGYAAFWLEQVADAGPAVGRNRFLVSSDATSAEFELVGSAADRTTFAGRLAEPWIAEIASLRPHARPSTEFERGDQRRAAG